MALSNCPECSKPISSAAKACPHCGYKVKKRIGCGTLILGGIILLGGLVILGSLVESPNSVNTKTPIVDATLSSWSRNDYGKATLTVKLKNTMSYRVKDIVLRITYSSKTGTAVGSREHTIYEFIDAEKTIEVTVEDYAPKDAERAGVIVVSSSQS